VPDFHIVAGAGVEPSDAYRARGFTVDGDVSARVVSPPEFSLWLITADLTAGTTIEWPARHGDEAVYVLDGALEVDGSALEPKVVPPVGAAVVEADAPATARAVGATRVVHMGPAVAAQPIGGLNGPPDAAGHGLHAVGPHGTYARVDADGDSHYYADSTCPTCRITLLSVARSGPWTSSAHSHTQDELIHVVSGCLHLGRRDVGPGDTLAIGAGVRYAFTGGDDGFLFLNYRADASEQHWPDGRAPLMEGGAINGLERVWDML
jgi:quercetin dioxygenase-like cupin family protein